MPDQKHPPFLSEIHWNATQKQVAQELKSFIEEFGSFTPELFTEMKFHLLRDQGLTLESRSELCEVSMYNALCPKCDYLYKAKICPLWYNLFKIIRWELVRRAPPCIQNAFQKKSISNVTKFLVKANLIDPPFYRVQRAPSCKYMRRWGYCQPDEYCRAMKTEYTLDYNAAREHVRISRTLDG